MFHKLELYTVYTCIIAIKEGYKLNILGLFNLVNYNAKYIFFFQFVSSRLSKRPVDHYIPKDKKIGGAAPLMTDPPSANSITEASLQILLIHTLYVMVNCIFGLFDSMRSMHHKAKSHALYCPHFEPVMQFENYRNDQLIIDLITTLFVEQSRLLWVSQIYMFLN